ncbi:hypothetical protein LTR78_005576 [Recurvomyces mirabilis]|uniref:Protein kinase domain-containing protein n=1 Tax=Recurvomyces mirabilis TaxID=574656 RepID=A0AAE0WMN5_9PEZI|nr:hypothetical protein LTR78_005576 [Recurvomyces mirabilis]KAK5151305.1 hypothetical protein LTS14_009475 [Recurvomyces mirabilis]
MICVILLADGTRVDSASLLGMGTDGFILRSGDYVLKAPKLYGYMDGKGTVQKDDDNLIHLTHLDAEKEVYQRLQGVPGVADFISCSPNGNGSLAEYIKGRGPPSLYTRWAWTVQATDAVKNCHDKGVLVFDIALRNFVLADDMGLRMIDFANSALLPPDSSNDMSKVDVDGCTVALDIFHLSNVIYSLLARREFHIDCAYESEWPALSDLPCVNDVPNGHIVRKCWMNGYATVRELQEDLHSCSVQSML